MNRRALLLALCVIFVSGVGVSLAVPNAQLTVSDISVDPGEPTAGEPFTLTPTVESSIGSDEAATVDFVRLEIDGEQIANRTNNGALSPGDSLDVPVTTTVEESGEYNVTVTVGGTDESGEQVTVSREETVVVSPVPQVKLTVDDVDVEPATPAVGAPVTVPITVSSSAASGQPIDVDAVIIRNESAELARAEAVGSVSAGESITVPLTTTFERAGERSLTVALEGTNANNQSVFVSQPLSLVVESGEPAIEIGDVGGVAGIPTDVPVNVSNPTETTLRNVVATVEGEGIDGAIDRRVVPALQPGESAALSFRLQPESTGETLLRTNVSYTTATGTDGMTQATTLFSTDPLEESVSVRVTRVSDRPEETGDELGVDVEGILDAGGSEEGTEREGDVRVIVSNLGNAALERVTLDPRAGERSLGERPVANRLAPGAEESIVLSLDRVSAAELVFEASYELAGEHSVASRTFDPGSSQGSVTVTGVDLEISGDRAVITGDLGNPGEGDVSGVVVSVEADTGVTPAYPSRDFFVGEIESNGFAPFELTATVDEAAAQIPLEVTYLVAGDDRTETVTLPVEDGPSPADGDGPSLFLVGGVLSLLVGLFVIILVFARKS